MKIREFKKIGLAMLMKSGLTTFFLTGFCLLLGEFVISDAFSTVKIDYGNLSLSSIYDQLLAAVLNTFNNNLINGILNVTTTDLPRALGLIGFSLVFMIVVVEVVQVGRDQYLLQARQDKLDSNLLFWGFNNKRYARIIYVQAIRWSLIGVGLLLGIVPGLYGYFRLRMLNYVICTKPESEPKQWLTQTMALSDGQLWSWLALELSFFGWRILNLFTFGLSRFVIEPYYQCTFTEVYCARANALKK